MAIRFARPTLMPRRNAMQRVIMRTLFRRWHQRRSPVAVGRRSVAYGSVTTPCPSSITSPDTRMRCSASTARYKEYGLPTASPCRTKRVNGRTAPVAMNHPPRFAQAEPVAGSSVTAAPNSPIARFVLAFRKAKRPGVVGPARSACPVAHRQSRKGTTVSQSGGRSPGKVWIQPVGTP